MKPPLFDYHRPSTRGEVDELLQTYGSSAKILAGGQSLMPMLNMRLVAPAHLIDINGLDDEPAEPEDEGDRIYFGPLVRHAAVQGSPLVSKRMPLLCKAMALVAHPPIRNRGTFTGSIAHADPSSELPAVFALLGGELLVRGARGRRRVPAAEAFLGPFEPAIEPDEWLEGVSVPAERPDDGEAIESFARRSSDYAICGVAALVRPDGDLRSASLAFFSVGDAPTVIDLPTIGVAQLAGPDLGRAVRELVFTQLDAPEDLHATAGYRRHLATVLATRAVRNAAAIVNRGNG